MGRLHRTAIFTLLATMMGCSSSTKDDPPPISEAIAAAMQQPNPAEPVAAGLVTVKQPTTGSVAQSGPTLRADQLAEVDRAAQLPDNMPTDLGHACDAVVEAYDGFMKRGSERQVLLWHDGRRHKMGERRAACIKAGNLKSAACQRDALAQPLASLADIDRTEAARLVLSRCADKFAGP